MITNNMISPITMNSMEVELQKRSAVLDDLEIWLNREIMDMGYHQFTEAQVMSMNTMIGVKKQLLKLKDEHKVNGKVRSEIH